MQVILNDLEEWLQLMSPLITDKLSGDLATEWTWIKEELLVDMADKGTLLGDSSLQHGSALGKAACKEHKANGSNGA